MGGGEGKKKPTKKILHRGHITSLHRKKGGPGLWAVLEKKKKKGVKLGVFYQKNRRKVGKRDQKTKTRTLQKGKGFFRTHGQKKKKGHLMGGGVPVQKKNHRNVSFPEKKGKNNEIFRSQGGKPKLGNAGGKKSSKAVLRKGGGKKTFFATGFLLNQWGSAAPPIGREKKKKNSRVGRTF